MKIKYSLPTQYLIVLIAICITQSCNESNNSSVQNSKRPRKGNAYNMKLINPNKFEEFRNVVGTIIHMGERRIYNEGGHKTLGDSVSYLFNSEQQLILEQVYTSTGKLFEVTTYKYDSTNKIICINTKNLDGGSPFAISFFYNNLNQVSSTKTNSSFTNEHEIYLYDDSNYLIEKNALDKDDNILRTTHYIYDKMGNLIEILISSMNGEIETNDKFKYNNLNQCIEREHEGIPINCAGRNKWKLSYNVVGDIIEEQTYDLIINNKYEYDDNKNWTKEFTFLNDEKDPNLITQRTFTYKK